MELMTSPVWRVMSVLCAVVAICSGQSSDRETNNNLSINFSFPASHDSTRTSFYQDIDSVIVVYCLSIEGEGRCLNFLVPEDISTSKATFTVAASSVLPNVDYRFMEYTEVEIRKKALLTFIQTDKPQYKPVQFRILSVDTNLRPKTEPIFSVWIENPSGTRMMQWSDIETQKGLVSLEMKLSEDPTQGDWTIKAEIGGNTESQTFIVKEYVLPKYDIEIRPPSYLVVSSPIIAGEICAKYTYGEPVKGNLKLNVCLKGGYAYHSPGNSRPCIDVEMMIQGCVPFQFSSDELMLNSRDFSIWDTKLVINATVEEEGTGIVLNDYHEGPEVEQTLLNIDTSESSDYFKPGLPYYGKVAVTHPDASPAVNEPMLIRVDNWRRGFNFNQTYTTDESGNIYLSLPLQEMEENQITSIGIQIVSANYNFTRNDRIHVPHEPRTFHNIRRWFSPSDTFLQVAPVRGSLNCGDVLRANVSYSTHEGDKVYKILYQVMARGNIVKEGYKMHPHADPSFVPAMEGATVHHTHLEIPIEASMSGDAVLLVFFIRDDAETIADSVRFVVNPCVDNNVSVSFSHSERLPGARTQLLVKADPGSLCAVGVVDKSVHLLGGSNQLSLAKVFSLLSQFDIKDSHSHYDSDEYCEKQMTAESPPPSPRRKKPKNRRPRDRNTRSMMPPGRYYSDYYDSSRAFQASGMVTLSDLTIGTRPCKEEFVYYEYDMVEDRGPPPMAFDGFPKNGWNEMAASAVDDPEPAVMPGKEKKSVDIRNYFPETWLWDLQLVGSRGQASMTKEVPHTITEWVASGFCTNELSGLGVSPISRLRAFQPFFVSFTLPYSIIRGETVKVPVTVFNYLNDCLKAREMLTYFHIQLNLKASADYSVSSGRRASVLVCGQESATHNYMITANTLGKINITIKATSIENTEIHDNNVIMSDQIGVKDAVTRELLVEPEGREIEYSFNSFVCPQDGETVMETADLTLPNGVVEGSARGEVTVIGDVMGPSLSGLDHLLKLPTGCGEQNMINFAPNIFVMQYLKATSQVTSDIETKALDFMRTGYQRELTYKHTDHSYSAFGNSDASGSTWLTAFVVKSFAQAKPYIFIDESDLTQSVDWFKSKQMENGCFPELGRVIHKDMKGGLSDGAVSPATITSFVLIAMMEAGIPSTDESVRNAVLCLDSQTVTDTYTISLMAYALTLWDSSSRQRNAAVARLENLANHENDMTYWMNREAPFVLPTDPRMTVCPFPQSHSANVEMTAYALLTYTSVPGDDEAIPRALPIVKWLSKQRNAHGGFASTQDTVVALQALAQYASLVFGQGVDLEVQTEALGLAQTFPVSSSNALLLQRASLPLPNRLSFSVTGSGCALVQANVKYNFHNMTDEVQPTFSLKSTVSRVENDCRKRNINVCTRYLGDDQASNMAVVSVKMVSGWIPDKASIKKLQGSTEIQLKRVDIDMNFVHLYFDEITENMICFDIVVEQNIEVSDPKPGLVHVYDYYEKEKSLTSQYSIRSICGTKEEIPMFLAAPHEEALDEGAEGLDVVQQRRVQPQFPGREVIEEDECPMCITGAPDDLMTSVCAAGHVYKVTVRRGRKPLKVTTDLRPGGRGNSMNINAKFNMAETCSCEYLQNQGQKLLILTNNEVVVTGNRKGLFNLSAADKIIAVENNHLIGQCILGIFLIFLFA
ncbi:hypothetical protein CAPTEDRAFT_228650 [Capitella teleta]|uniref:NTR domain-containing protein n=1 Tax=Capitella teleta TaxID=283909 RepID=R7TMS3_CAPTE|nr:hypothetical protein CAPTEDRAFT_228650 [Capitella teleta]|eukprot:ELT94944.1 hypothetical protein CAPTEDRAFT_228650 [Capitella teleta]